EIEELADALAEHVVDHPLQQVTALDGGVGTGRYAQALDHRISGCGCLPVDREVVLAAELVVPDTGRVGITDADRVIGGRLGGCRRLSGHRPIFFRGWEKAPSDNRGQASASLSGWRTWPASRASR